MDGWIGSAGMECEESLEECVLVVGFCGCVVGGWWICVGELLGVEVRCGGRRARRGGVFPAFLELRAKACQMIGGSQIQAVVFSAVESSKLKVRSTEITTSRVRSMRHQS